MKAKLIFNFEKPDDLKAHTRAIKSTDMAIVLHGINNALYSERNIKSLKGKIRQYYEDYSINLDELLD